MSDTPIHEDLGLGTKGFPVPDDPSPTPAGPVPVDPPPAGPPPIPEPGGDAPAPVEPRRIPREPGEIFEFKERGKTSVD